MGILDQIANPQMADIAGALDYRQKRLDADEAKRKEIRMGQLIAEALPNIKKDSPLYEFASTQPREFAAFSKVLGIPLNAGDRMQEFADDTNMLYTLAQDDPRAAFEYAMELSEERKASGRESAQIDRFIQGMRDDPQRTMTGLFVMQRSLNRDEARKDRELDIAERRLDQQGKDSSTPYFTPIHTKDGVFAFDARTGGIAPAASATGNAVISDKTDVGLQGDLAGAKTKGSGEATRIIDTKKAISRSNQLVGAIQEAKKLIPQATGSYAGAARDAAGRALGITSDKSKASAQLETLAGWMVSNVPRMEGPQSDKDVENYRTMAAKVGDRTVPTEERLAALELLESLQSKYSEINNDIVGGSEPNKQSKTQENQFTGQDKQAFDWAQANPNDPRSAAILQRLGVQ